MIETQGDARRLASIDGATALGQLADDVVVAILHWKDHGDLERDDLHALRQAIDWLERAKEGLDHPLRLASAPSGSSALPSLDSFGPSLTGAALGALGAGMDAQAMSSALDAIRLQTQAVVERKADPAEVDRVLSVFEALSRAMLSSADAMLAPSARGSWTTTSGS